LSDSVIENSENSGSYTQSGQAARFVGIMTRVTIHDVSSAILFTIDSTVERSTTLPIQTRMSARSRQRMDFTTMGFILGREPWDSR
jgi:hypothetical protein